jgi:thymidylate kinase
MFTIALIGADGAGKSTVGRAIEHALPVPMRYVYMGVNFEASNIMLPTTRLVMWWRKKRGTYKAMGGPPDLQQVKSKPKGVLGHLKSSLRLLNLLAEEWYRQLVVWSYLRRGEIVLFDRHFFIDYYAAHIAGQSPNTDLYSRIHGWVLQHLYPRPDLVIMLDAPAEVLFARKGEGTIELLNRRRNDYLQLQHEIRHFVVVDVQKPEDQVIHEVSAIIRSFYEARGGKLVAAND